MRFTKKVSYKLSRPVAMLALAGASLFTSCSKDDNDEIVPQISRTIPFWPHMYDNIEDLEQIKRIADSAQICEIVFQVKNTGEYAWYGVNMKAVANRLEKAFAATNGKGTAGKEAIFKMAERTDNNQDAEPRLNKLGYTVEYYQAAQAMQRAR